MDPRAIIDALLEITVIPSFSRLGPAIRGRLFEWQAPSPGSLIGRTALVTGPTSGLGRATAETLADLGARVVLVGRDPARLAAVRLSLLARHGGDDRFPVHVADLSNLADVRAVAEEILRTEVRLDVLVDSAGAINHVRRETADGLEATFALMVVGPFVLTGQLLPLLRATPGARVIAVASGGMYLTPLDLDDLGSAREPYSGPQVYGRAKRASVALMREWARREAAAGPAGPTGVTFTAMHPGWADTPGLAASLPRFHRIMGPLLRSTDEGIDTIVRLTTLEDPSSAAGRLLLDRRSRPFDRIPATRLSAADRRRLWDAVVELSDLPDPWPDPAAGSGHGRRQPRSR